MSAYTVTREYPFPLEEVWTVMTDPAYVAQWTTTGRGGRPEGFAAAPGTHFRFVGRPTLGWAGTVYCEVVSAAAPHHLHYTWRGEQDGEDVTDVVYTLEATAAGTRFTWAHTGFTGPGGFAMCKLLANVRRRMLTHGVPPVLAALHAERGSSAPTRGPAGRPD